MKLCNTFLDLDRSICFDYNGRGYYMDATVMIGSAAITWEEFFNRHPQRLLNKIKPSAPQSFTDSNFGEIK